MICVCLWINILKIIYLMKETDMSSDLWFMNPNFHDFVKWSVFYDVHGRALYSFPTSMTLSSDLCFMTSMAGLCTVSPLPWLCQVICVLWYPWQGFVQFPHFHDFVKWFVFYDIHVRAMYSFPTSMTLSGVLCFIMSMSGLCTVSPLPWLCQVFCVLWYPCQGYAQFHYFHDFVKWFVFYDVHDRAM